MFAVVFNDNSTFIAEYSLVMQVGAVCCPGPQIQITKELCMRVYARVVRVPGS
jgi:hypothetical protein